MRTRLFAAPALMVALTVALATAGCARGSDNSSQVATAQDSTAKSSASPSASASRDPNAALKFTQCMREQGLTWFPDPSSDGKLSIMTPKGVDPKKVEAAQQACRKFMPGDGGADAPKPTASEMAAFRKMAQCMRDQGIKNFPDPSPDGGIKLDKKTMGDLGPGNSTFDAAQKICDQYAPKHDGTDTHQGGTDAGNDDKGQGGITTGGGA
jgi:hypothetical protein